jgi:hypothetical protein
MQRKVLRIGALVAIMLGIGAPAFAEVKRITYTPVPVRLAPGYKPNAAFEAFRSRFSDAVAKKDTAALLALVAPGFVWTQNNVLTSDFDPGRDPLHNLRVVFGFRALGKDVDGGVEGGPYWDVLAALASDGTFSEATEGRHLICTPTSAAIVDEQEFEQTRAKIEEPDEAADWHFLLRSTVVTKAPADKEPPIASLGLEAVPVLRSHPPVEEGKPAAPATHYEVLLPSGRAGWIPASAARRFQADRLCFAPTAQGEWKIAIYDSAE